MRKLAPSGQALFMAPGVAPRDYHRHAAVLPLLERHRELVPRLRLGDPRQEIADRGGRKLRLEAGRWRVLHRSVLATSARHCWSASADARIIRPQKIFSERLTCGPAPSSAPCAPSRSC